MTECPFFSKYSVRCEPIKPLPPVMRYVILYFLDIQKYKKEGKKVIILSFLLTKKKIIIQILYFCKLINEEKMIFKGQLNKMITQLAEPVQYYLNISGDIIHLNELFGKKIIIQHTGYQCIECGNSEPVFRMGFCKKCFFESPFASDSILKPELSTAHLGIEERNLEIEKNIQLQPHIVYLAYTGDVKVGVTRESQIPTRWIDQGATFALPIARTENRYEAGVIEVALKQHISDKTNWRKMLQNEYEEEIDLLDFKNKIEHLFPVESKKFAINEEKIWKIDFPYTAPEKILAFTLDKHPKFSGILQGIKGQYLCFEDGNVINIRNHEGYVVDIEI